MWVSVCDCWRAVKPPPPCPPDLKMHAPETEKKIGPTCGRVSLPKKAKKRTLFLAYGTCVHLLQWPSKKICICHTQFSLPCLAQCKLPLFLEKKIRKNHAASPIFCHKHHVHACTWKVSIQKHTAKKKNVNTQSKTYSAVQKKIENQPIGKGWKWNQRFIQISVDVKPCWWSLTPPLAHAREVRTQLTTMRKVNRYLVV